MMKFQKKYTPARYAKYFKKVLKYSIKNELILINETVSSQYKGILKAVSLFNIENIFLL